MKTITFIIVAAAIVFVAGALGCLIGEIVLKTIKKIFKL
tara:strand:- start:535 stop:651 length:117 start_codon:yes stop_codon:yes gene_type:complete